jgi:hypothetical protein
MSSTSVFVRGARLASLALLVVVLGCGTDVSELASSVRDAASQGLDKAKEAAGDVSRSVADRARGAAGSLSETLGMAGSFDLVVGEPLKIDACYARCIAVGPDRPAVLQLQSYQESERESFPSAFLRAEVTAADIGGLVGQTVEAQLFVKRRQDQPTLYTRDAPVQVTIRRIEDGLLIGEISGGALSSHETAAPVAVSGSFRGLIQQGG